MAEYRSKYRGEEVDALLDKIAEGNVGAIDSALSLESENPVQNKVITEELNKKVNKTDIATINGQTLTNGGNIEVSTNAYDDTEIKGKLTELSLKVGEFKVKDASVSGNTLNITKDDGTILPFTPQGGGGGIPDAPSDGKQYARQDGAWTEVTLGGEKLVLVNDITLTEQAGVTLTQTDDGIAYNFESILIDIDNKTQLTSDNYVYLRNHSTVLAMWNTKIPAGNTRIAFIDQKGYRALFFTSTWATPFIGSRENRSDLTGLPITSVSLGTISANSNIKVYAVWKR